MNDAYMNRMPAIHNLILSFCALAMCVLCTTRSTNAQAMPYVGQISPPTGPDSGGYIITISGRNLGFLDIDCAVKIGPQMGKNVKVTDSWDKLEVEVPACSMCGKVDIVVMCDGVESNKVPFVMTNNCYGPIVGSSSKPDLPTRFSARENCTVCMDLVHLTMAAVADKTSYQGLQSAIQQGW